MKCGRADCPDDGAWIPTLVLHPRHSLVAAWFQVSTTVCEKHKTKNAEVYLNDESWKAFLAWFDERKLERPHRSLSKVDYTAIVGEADQGRADAEPHVFDRR